VVYRYWGAFGVSKKLGIYEGFWILFGCFMFLFGGFSKIFAYAKCPGPEISIYSRVKNKLLPRIRTFREITFFMLCVTRIFKSNFECLRLVTMN
jgi:hypothetical protein